MLEFRIYLYDLTKHCLHNLLPTWSLDIKFLYDLIACTKLD